MKSPVKRKRFRAILDDGRKVDFGYDGAYTYIDGADDKIRQAYRARHYANSTEKKLIDGLIVSPSLLSWYVIWGESRDVGENVRRLNAMWRSEKK